MKIASDTNSYMQLCLNMNGGALYLFVPTYYDSDKKEWMGFVHLAKAKKTIYGIGKTSKELEESFNKSLRTYLEGEFAAETFSLFKPLSYWDEMIDSEEKNKV